MRKIIIKLLPPSLYWTSELFMQYLLSRFLNIREVFCQKKNIHKTSLFYTGQSTAYTVIKYSLWPCVPDLTKTHVSFSSELNKTVHLISCSCKLTRLDFQFYTQYINTYVILQGNLKQTVIHSNLGFWKHLDCPRTSDSTCLTESKCYKKTSFFSIFFQWSRVTNSKGVWPGFGCN